MKYLKYLLFCLFTVFSCHKDDDDQVDSLMVYLSQEDYEIGAVIACSASEEVTNDVLTFYYPEPGVKNVRFYESEIIDIDNQDFSKYTRQFIESEPLFNDYLRRFKQENDIERWIIVTYELDNEIKISNPIRTKQISKPSVWNSDVAINQFQIGMPLFTWEDNRFGDNAIYFQIFSDSNDDLLSGTYTHINNFQYYNITNVVLNITRDTPPELVSGSNYNFTLMDVSADNWVNWVIQKSFVSE